MTAIQKAIIWSGMEKILSFGSNFAINILLARLLSVNDYGLIAMLSIFYSFSQALVDSGFSSALIQRKKCTKMDYSSVFLFNIAISIIIYFILFFSAPYIAKIYNNSNLILIIRIYCLNLIILSVYMVHRTLLIKKLRFKILAISTLISTICAGTIATIMAYLGFSYWSLVVQSLITSIINGIIIILYCKWIPLFKISIKSLKSLWNFGFNIMFTAIISSIYSNIYSLIIGHKYNSIKLGYFDRSYALSFMFPTAISDFSMRALYPIQSKIQEDDMKLNSNIKKVLHLTMMVIFPINIFISFNSHEIVYCLLGNKWLPISSYVSLITICALTLPISQINNNAIKSKGKSDYLLLAEAIKKLFGTLVVLITCQYDFKVMLYGLFIYSIADFVCSAFFLNKTTGLSIYSQIIELIPLFIISLISVSIGLSLSLFFYNIYFKLFISLIISILSYLLILSIKKDTGFIYYISLIKKLIYNENRYR